MHIFTDLVDSESSNIPVDWDSTGTGEYNSAEEDKWPNLKYIYNIVQTANYIQRQSAHTKRQIVFTKS